MWPFGESSTDALEHCSELAGGYKELVLTLQTGSLGNPETAPSTVAASSSSDGLGWLVGRMVGLVAIQKESL